MQCEPTTLYSTSDDSHIAVKSNILRGLTRMLDPTEDFDNIATAEEQMRSVAENRARVLEERYAELKGTQAQCDHWRRALNDSSSSYTQPRISKNVIDPSTNGSFRRSPCQGAPRSRRPPNIPRKIDKRRGKSARNARSRTLESQKAAN